MKEEQQERKLHTKDDHRHHQVGKEYLGELEYILNRSRKIVTEKGVARKGGGRIAEAGHAEPKEKSWRKVMVSNNKGV